MTIRNLNSTIISDKGKRMVPIGACTNRVVSLFVSRTTTTTSISMISSRLWQRPLRLREFSSASPMASQQPQHRRRKDNKKRPRRENERIVMEEQIRDMPKWPAVASILMVPVMIGTWQLSEYVFGNRQLQLNEQLRQNFEKTYPQKQQTQIMPFQHMPILFPCIVRRTHGFTHCLTGVKIGDVVEVLEEGVGPQREYNLCRLMLSPTANDKIPNDESANNGVVYGWFPHRWLQKLDHYEQTIPKDVSKEPSRQNDFNH